MEEPDPPASPERTVWAAVLTPSRTAARRRMARAQPGSPAEPAAAGVVLEPPDAAALTQAFPHLPFALKHRFAGNPLLTLPKLAELVRDLPRDRLEYNSGKAAIDQRPGTTPTVTVRATSPTPSASPRRRPPATVAS